MMNEMRSAMVPVSKWGEGVGVALSTVARRWGLGEEETRELFGFIPTIGSTDEVTFLVAETGQVLWESQHILFAEGDFPDLAKGQGREILVAMRALAAAVEAAWTEPGWFSELLSDYGVLRERLSADSLAALASMEPVALRAEHERLVEAFQAHVE